MSKKLLKKLTEANGVPGNEHEVRRLIESETKDLLTKSYKSFV